MIFDRLIDGVVSKVLNTTDARIVYGEAETQGERTVIPVARLSTAFGFGGGAGQGQDEGESGGAGSGGGGGGTVGAKPIGYIEVTPAESKFVPIQDTTAIALRVVTLVGIAMILFALAFMRGRRAS